MTTTISPGYHGRSSCWPELEADEVAAGTESRPRREDPTPAICYLIPEVQGATSRRRVASKTRSRTHGMTFSSSFRFFFSLLLFTSFFHFFFSLLFLLFFFFSFYAVSQFPPNLEFTRILPQGRL
jgi:hypothetical protein